MQEVTGAQSATNTGSTLTSSTSKLTRQQFMKILTAELQNQNPLEPLKQNEFIGQLTGLQNLRAVNELNTVVNNLKDFQRMSTAGNLIGRTIHGTTTDGQEIEGNVDQVSISGSDVFLHVKDTKVPVDSVTKILE